MSTRLPAPSDADLERLLRGCADRLMYPPTPDVVDTLLPHLGEASPRTRSWLRAGPSAAPLGTSSPESGRNNLQLESTVLGGFGDRQRDLRSYTKQALKLAAAMLVFATVTALLALVFRGFDDESRPAIAPPPETPTVTQERLYVVSDVYGEEEGFSVQVHGRVTAYDADTGEQHYIVDVGSQVDAVLSPDGSRLYVANISDGGDSLIALDAATGRELWRTAIQDRVHWIMGLGPSTLAASPDNQRLYVYNMDTKIQVIDANTGESVTALGPTINCPAKLHISPDGRTLYLVCHERSGTMVIDLATGQALPDIDVSRGAASGTALSPDGRLLYIVSAGRVTIVDMDARAVIEEVPLESGIAAARLLRLVTLSLDGTRLFVGLGAEAGADSVTSSSAHEIVVFDTSTWRETGRITTEKPITGQTLAGAASEQAIFGAHNAFREGTSTPTTASILKLSLDSDPTLFATKEREEVLALIAGQVEVPATELSEKRWSCRFLVLPGA